MKTKEFNATKELEKIVQKISNDETLFAIFYEEKDELSVFESAKDEHDIACILATIISMSLKGEGNEGMDRVTQIILEALKLVQTSNSIAGLKLATEMLKNAAEKAGLVDNDNEEDCGDCELMKVCDEKKAIEYRKEHGIPRPKKGKARKVDVN